MYEELVNKSNKLYVGFGPEEPGIGIVNSKAIDMVSKEEPVIDKEFISKEAK